MSIKADIIRSWDLYAISDISIAKGKAYPEIFEALLSAGIKVVQLRDKTSTFEELYEVGPDLVRLAHENDATLIVNDNPYLARDIGADGVHVGQTDFPVDICREILGPDKIVGLSAHTRIQANKAESLDVDYIGMGPIFPTSTKKSEYPSLGLEVVRWASEKLNLPVVFIGGINLDNLPDVLAAGARCCAVISGIMASDDIVAASRKYSDVFKMIQS